MEFLVSIDVRLPPDMPAERRAALLEAELERGVALHRAGAIVRIWRIPGAQRNVGVWRAEDATELHALISSLPAYPYISASVTPLAVHPVEAAGG